MQKIFAQNQPIDTLIQKITEEKDDNLRFELMNNFISNTAESNPMLLTLAFRAMPVTAAIVADVQMAA